MEGAFGGAAGAHADKVVYEQDGIFIFVYETAGDRISAGKLSVVQKAAGVWVEWKQTEETEYSLEQVSEWSMVNTTVGYNADKNAGSEALEFKTHKGRRREIVFNLNELKCFKCTQPAQGWSHITFYLRDGCSHSPMYFQMGNVDHFIATLTDHANLIPSREDGLWYIKDSEMEALDKSISSLAIPKDRKKHLLSKFLQDPYMTTLSSFAKVTKTLFDYMGMEDVARARADEGMAEILHEALIGLDINQQKEPGFEVVTKKKPAVRPVVNRGLPLTQQQWIQHLDSEGKVMDKEQLLHTIFRGGIEPSLRPQVWKFLLGCYSLDSTYKEREEARQKHVDDYYRMKLQWKTISHEQEERFCDFRDRKHSIEKDVNRTDRSHPFYKGENNKNIQVLYDILMTYCMYNFDLGYVQGMNDLLSPILVQINNEVDSFVCFSGFMDKVASNFVLDMNGITTQLQQLHALLKFVDPDLCDLFEKYMCQHLVFCFRWLLLLFKREFNFPDIMTLWEVFWTGLPCKNFHLLFALAILEAEKSTLLSFTSSEEILKHINRISERMDPEEMLKKAEGIYLELRSDDYLPACIQDILDLHCFANGEASAGAAVAVDVPTSAEIGDFVSKSPQSNASSVDTSSIELLPECDSEMRFQKALELQYL